MSDFVLREQDGWHEITHMMDPNRLSLETLWMAVGRRDWKEAESLIWEALYSTDEKDYAAIVGAEDRGYPYVAIITSPDDMSGEVTRIWIKMP